MGIFDIFTGKPAKEAAAKNAAALAANQAAGTDILQGNLATGTGILQNNQTAGTGVLQNNQTAGTNTLRQGQTDSLASLDKAGGYYAPLAAKYGAGTGLYMDSLGVNGADGNARATGAFQAGPGYQWGVSQALDGIERSAAARGGLGGGNTLAALSDRAGNMANQEYGGWQDRLAGFVSPEFQAAGGQAGAEIGKAGVYGNTAGSIAGLGTGTAAGIANLGMNTANTIANLGTNTANSRVGLGTKTTQGINDQTTQAANAKMQGSQNLWGLGMQGATALATGGGGGTSLLGGLGNMFGGGQTQNNPYNSMPKVGGGW